MEKGKKIYFVVLLLLVFLASTAFFSYAFFSSVNEEHGKLNIVAGNLNYKIESDDLANNQITVAPKEIKKITIKLSSLNAINSKYELYYTLNKSDSNIRAGYDINTKDSVLGTIDAKATKVITLMIHNDGDNDVTITFNVIGGLENNDLVLVKGNSLNQVVGKYAVYDIGDEITLTDGSKWHVLESSDSDSEYVTLLSDYNLNIDGSYNIECGRNIDGNHNCSSVAFDIDNTNIYNENDSNNVGYFIKNTYMPLIISKFPDATSITLPTAEQIVNADGKKFNNQGLALTNDWLMTTNYWTKSSNSAYSQIVWTVYGIYSTINNGTTSVSDICGVRPTITVPKKYILNTMSSTTELAIGTSVEAIDGSKWHVLEKSGGDSKYVTLLSDYNLNRDGSYALGCTSNEYSSCSVAFDPDNTNVYNEDDSNNVGYFIKNAYRPLITKSLFETINVTLPTAEQIVNADGKKFNNQGLSLTTNWLTTTNYWTKSSNSTYSQVVWTVYGIYSTINDGTTSVSNVCGTRPVITTLKTNLLTK